MYLGINDEYKGKDVAAQIEQRMDFHPTFRQSKPCQLKDRTTQFNCGCDQSVDSFFKLVTIVIIGIELPGLCDQHLCKVTINTPTPIILGIGKGLLTISDWMYT